MILTVHGFDFLVEKDSQISGFYGVQDQFCASFHMIVFSVSPITTEMQVFYLIRVIGTCVIHVQ